MNIISSRSPTQVVLEWEPFDRMVVEMALELPGGSSSMVFDYQLTPTDGGTHFTSTVGRLAGSGLRRVLWRSFIRAGKMKAQRQLVNFRDRIEEDFAQRNPAGDSPMIELGSIAESAAGAVAAWNASTSLEGDSAHR